MALRHEQRVVTKTAEAAGRKLNPTLTGACKDLRAIFIRITYWGGALGVGFRDKHERDDTAKAPGALFQRHVLKQAEEFGVVLRIG